MTGERASLLSAVTCHRFLELRTKPRAFGGCSLNVRCSMFDVRLPIPVGSGSAGL